MVNYTVREGDTLNSIAARFGVPVQELIRVNNIPYPYYIYVGQTIFVPTRPAPAPVPQNVERRLDRLEDRAERAERQLRSLDNRVDRLEQRVSRLEQPARPRPRPQQ